MAETVTLDLIGRTVLETQKSVRRLEGEQPGREGTPRRR